MTQVMTPGGDYGPFCINGKSPIPWDVCINEIGWKFFIGQGGFPEDPSKGWSTKINLVEARAHNVELVGEYFWLDPEDNAQAVINHWSEDIYANKPDFVHYDDEQTQKMNGTVFDPQQAADFIEEVYNGVSNNFKDIPHEYYGRPGFVSQYRSPLLSWFAKRKRPWLAANPSWGMVRYYLSAAEIALGKTQIVTNYNTKPLLWKWGNLFDDGMGPDMSLCPNADGWMWQTGGNRMMNGEIWELDWDYWLGPFDTMLAWAKKVPAPIPPPVPVPDPVYTLETARSEIAAVKIRMAKIEALPWYQQFFPVVTK